MNKISRGDVYYVDLDNIFNPKVNMVHYQKGIRPCVIISNNKNNTYNSNVIIMPLTTKKDCLPQHQYIYVRGVKSYVLPECILSIDKSLLLQKHGFVNRQDYKYIEKALSIQLGL